MSGWAASRALCFAALARLGGRAQCSGTLVAGHEASASGAAAAWACLQPAHWQLLGCTARALHTAPPALAAPHQHEPERPTPSPAPASAPAPAPTHSSSGDASEAPQPPLPQRTSRRDATATAAETVYPSSSDDNLGVQKIWFNSLFSQLNVVHRAGLAPAMAGRQKEIFVAVEKEFEGLWERHIRGKGLQGTAHRGMMMCCLAIATHKVLRYESGDDELVAEVVRTNLGGQAVKIMMRLHRARLWLLLKLLAEDPFTQAVRFLPSLQGDFGALVGNEVVVGKDEATWKCTSCTFHEVLAAEDSLELLPEFCCQYSMQWLSVFGEYGVRVGLESSLAYDDPFCLVRISRPAAAAAAPEAKQ